MRLPGKRHRDLSPSTVLGDHDLDAIDLACDELERGGYAAIPWTPPLYPNVPGSWTTGGSSAYLQSAAGGNVAYAAWPLIGGDHVQSFDVIVYANGALAVTVTLERVTIAPGTALPLTIETVVSDANTTASAIWTRKRFVMIDEGRPVGLRIDEQTHYYRLKITAGQAGDRFTFASGMIVGRPPPVTL